MAQLQEKDTLYQLLKFQMPSTNFEEKIRDYYLHCEESYRKHWDLDHSLAMHFGYWDQTTHTLSDALRRENEILAEIAQIKKEDRVLDAGCGVGGTSLFLAKNYGCMVDGITICQNQVDTANKYAALKKILPSPRFALMDYRKTDYPDESFDVVLAVESVCHAEDKLDFVKEAFRVLKKGGRLTIADGFLTRKEYKPEERAFLRSYAEGWAVPDWDLVHDFEQKLTLVGFQRVGYRNVTSHVMPSIKILNSFQKKYETCVPAELEYKKQLIFKNRQASCVYQFECYENRLIEFGIFHSEKPLQ